MRVTKLSWGTFAIVVVLAAACGSSTTSGNDAAAGSSGGGSSGSAGTTGGAGTMGGAGTSGNAGTSGSAGTSGNAGTSGGGTQLVGAACANTTNCSQADGPAVCCLQISTCVLDGQCPSSPNYVSCETTPCSKSGWVCCNAGGMHFCTKQSGCP